MDTNVLKLLPPVEIESRKILKKCTQANRYLAELKGICGTIPNENILINTLSIQEAKDSSAVENIITTHDELFKEGLFSKAITNSSVKEVYNYSEAIKKGYALVLKTGLLTNNTILEIQSCLEKNRAGFRKLPGTALKNDQTGEIVYEPPQNYQEILKLMGNLEQYINADELSDADPLIKMAIIHYQFESIHPFYDGNGRTGRIINILYLVQQKRLDIPILYLSRYIIKNKSEYYRLLQNVRTKGDWESWILYILDGIEQTARETIAVILDIRKLMLNYKHRIRANHKFYSQDLLNSLFNHPYTKIEFIERDLGVTRKTAAKYLEALATDGFLRKDKIGVGNYYVNEPLYDIFTRSQSSE
ncbi:MAG: Fic family protein [Bacillota bacterium]